MGEIETRAKVTGDPEKVQADKESLEKAPPIVWTDFETNPIAALDFPTARSRRSRRTAGLTRVIGTDRGEFRQSFDRFLHGDGEPIPPGQRGFLPRSARTRPHKNPPRELDDIREQVHDKHRSSPTSRPPGADERLPPVPAHRVPASPDDAKAIEAGLRDKFPDEGRAQRAGHPTLKVDDARSTPTTRFLRPVAPRIKPTTSPSATRSRRAYTKAGYVRSVNLKVYGTYDFKGLETSTSRARRTSPTRHVPRALRKMTASQQAC